MFILKAIGCIVVLLIVGVAVFARYLWKAEQKRLAVMAREVKERDQLRGM